MSDEDDAVRLDKWLWAARFFKTRALASEAIAGGKVTVNGSKPKRAKPVAVGDEISVRSGPYEHVVHVVGLAVRRGSASIAATLYAETDASRTSRERLIAQHRLAPILFGHDKGRPSKKERRDIERFRRGDG
ncbi:MAG: ribosome-associated heat shock protein Hsp15 [Gemmatimonadaceae bacterium]